MLKKNNTSKTTFELKNKGTIHAVRPIRIAQDLSYNWGEDVVVYDVKEKTPLVSYYVVASAANSQRLKALTTYAKDSLYDNYKEIDHVEGGRESTWVLIDAKDIVIQLFTKEERARVQIDALYASCPHKVIVQKEEPNYKRRKKVVYNTYSDIEE